MLSADRPAVLVVVQQHADEAAHLRATRSVLVRAPHVRMLNLQRLDERLAAHLDGLSESGRLSRELCAVALASPGVGEVFAATSTALEDKDNAVLQRLLTLAASLPPAQAGLTSAFGWMARERLQGIVVSLLGSQDPFSRGVGVATCAMHRVDPGLASGRRILDSSPMVRARALRSAGDIGCEDAVPALTAAVGDDDAECRFWATWSCVLLGNRGTALDALTGAGSVDGPYRLKAFRLALQAMKGGAAHDVLRRLAQDPARMRWVIQGSGIVGDPVYVPWLIGHMDQPETARLAGEAFTLTAGADLSALNLETTQPEEFESGPNENPDDANIEMDPDDGLPWPDREKVAKWWVANATRFQNGQRLLHGQTGHARALHRRAQERLPTPAHPRRALPLSAQSWHAALQHERAGVAATATARDDDVRHGGCKTHSGRARRRVSRSGCQARRPRQRDLASTDEDLAAHRRHLRRDQRVAVLPGVTNGQW